MSCKTFPANGRVRAPGFLILALLVDLLACDHQERPAAPTPNTNIQTTLSLADTVVVPGDTIKVTVRITNRGKSPQSFVFGCGYSIGIEVENGSGVTFIWDTVCPTVVVHVTLRPGETESRTAHYVAVDYRDGQPLVPGAYIVRGGLWGDYSHDYPWAEQRILVVSR